MLCVFIIAYSVCPNGDMVGSVVPQRGLRQGDSLSPYLFIICAKLLSALLRAKKIQGHIHGCCLARNAPQISHLLLTIITFSLG